MAAILIYDEATGIAKRYLPFENTPEYSQRSDVLINPDVSALLASGVPLRDWKVEEGSVRELNEAEKAARAIAEDAAAQEAAANFLATVRAGAKKAAGDRLSDTELTIRAVALVVLDEINALRTAAGLPTRSPAQLKAAVDAKIDAGNADSIS